MKNRKDFFEQIIAFLVCTACITIMEGIMGMLFFPDQKMGYEAFFSPPIFGFCSVLLGVLLDLVTRSKKELSVKQVLVRRGIHLLLIEGLVFGVNYMAGAVFNPLTTWTLAAAIAVVFVMVYVVLWLNDRRSANLFNENLKRYQKKIMAEEQVPD
ncbi:MAG: DUF3021 family protein [Lachnospiraceae bacterium]|nr:DUF3021 family protein [Lachnospiraceae bacterium]